MLKINSTDDVKEILQLYNREKEYMSLLSKTEDNTNLKPNPDGESSTQDIRNDSYCWICHKEGNVLCCEVCPRVFHLRCLGEDEEPPGDWVCPECQTIMKAEDTDSRSPAMAMLDMNELCRLLKFTLNKMRQHAPEAFLRPVSKEQFPSYSQYVFHPMDLSTLEKNIQGKMYGCTESFLADVKWILHNCIIFNGYQHQLTNSAKNLVKLCKFEMEEIEICPDCYFHASLHKDHWFCEPCRKPHVVVWAKVKGFPFWPAKVMRIIDGNVDVRFFGAHDRSSVTVNQCYLISKEMPTPLKCKKKGSFESALEEITIYAYRIREIFGTFEYADIRTPFDPENPPLYSTIKLPKLLDITQSPPPSRVASPLPNINLPVTFAGKIRMKTLKDQNEYDMKRKWDQPNLVKSKKEDTKSSKGKIKEGKYGKYEKSKPSKNLSLNNNNLSLSSLLSSSSSSSTSSVFSSSSSSSSSSETNSQLFIKNIKTEQTKCNMNARKRTPPVGIFEVSDESTIKMPALLEINIPTLNLKKVNSNNGKIVEKLESKIQQLEEINKENSDNETNIGTVTENKTLQPSGSKENILEETTSSVWSIEENKTNTISGNIRHSVLDLLSDTDSDDRPLSELCHVSIKTKENFSQKLNNIIESCKAKLGIKEIKDDIEIIDSDDDYIPSTNQDISSEDEEKKSSNTKIEEKSDFTHLLNPSISFSIHTSKTTIGKDNVDNILFFI